MRRWLALMVLLMVLVNAGIVSACGVATSPFQSNAAPTAVPTSTPVPTPTMEAGWTLYEKPEDGYAIMLPPTWQNIDNFDSDTVEGILQTFIEHSPNANMSEETIRQYRQYAESGLKFICLDFDPETNLDGFTTNVNLIKLTSPAQLSLETSAQANVAELENTLNVIKPVQRTRLTLSIGQVERFQYKLIMSQKSGELLTVSGTQYLAIKGKDAFFLTLTTLEKYQQRYAPIFEKIVQSFRFVD